MSAAAQLTGADLGDKELVFTFDDGPGPAAVTGALGSYLRSRPSPVPATFFVNGACIAPTGLDNGSCGAPTAGAEAILAQLVADGHTIANHSTTHRDLTRIRDADDLVADITETDLRIAPYVAWNRLYLRAPFGSWSGTVHARLDASPMTKYVGPIYWNAGGGPIDQGFAADWECWQRGMSSRACGDLYLSEIRAARKGIVLFHDASAGRNGNTLDMIRYIVPILEGEGFTFKTLEDVPAIRALLPACDPSCATCSGPGANACTACKPGNTLTAGTCAPCTGGFCNTCPENQWAARDGCRPCTVCPDGTSATTACTGTADTICQAGANPRRKTPSGTPEPTPSAGEDEGTASGCASAARPGPGGVLIALATLAAVRRRRRSLPLSRAATT